MTSAMSPFELKRVKVYFELPEEESGYPPDRVESLWAEQIGPQDFKIDNIPIYVRGIASGDIVSAQPGDDGELHFKGLLGSSGNSVFRLYVFEEKQVAALRQALRELGYESEQSHVANLIAVEVPASKPIHPFLDLIVKQAEAGRLEYQEAALRHQI